MIKRLHDVIIINLKRGFSLEAEKITDYFKILINEVWYSYDDILEEYILDIISGAFT